MNEQDIEAVKAGNIPVTAEGLLDMASGLIREAHIQLMTEDAEIHPLSIARDAYIARRRRTQAVGELVQKVATV